MKASSKSLAAIKRRPSLRFLSLLVCAQLAFAQGLDQGPLDQGQSSVRKMLRVLLQEGRPSLRLNNQDSVSLYLNSPFEAGAASLYDGPGNLNFERCGPNLCVSAGSKLVLKTTKPLYVQTYRKPFEINGLGAYRGMLLVSQSSQTLVRAVNVIHVEDYLRGVLPSEMGKIPPNAFDALKAQAVAARTYAVRNLKPLSAPYDLSSDVKSQVYKGVRSEYALSDSAIAESRDQVLTYQGKLINAYFHANSGGYTADPSEIWGKGAERYLNSHLDEQKPGKAWGRNATSYKWKREWPRAVFDSLIRTNAAKAGGRPKLVFNKVLGFNILSRSKDGRISRLEVQTNQGPVYFGGDYLRLLLPDARAERLPSSKFEIVQFDSVTVSLKGLGLGHGVGMDQSGAIQRSLYGQDYQDILNAYYPGTLLSALSSL